MRIHIPTLFRWIKIIRVIRTYIIIVNINWQPPFKNITQKSTLYSINISNVSFTFTVTTCFSNVISSTIFDSLTNSRLRHNTNYLHRQLTDWREFPTLPFIFYFAHMLCCFTTFAKRKHVLRFIIGVACNLWFVYCLLIVIYVDLCLCHAPPITNRVGV